MPSVTVNVSFPKQLLNAMDTLAKREARSRSDLLRAAVRVYLDRRERWDKIFAFWQEQARRAGLKPEDVAGMVADARRTRARNP